MLSLLLLPFTILTEVSLTVFQIMAQVFIFPFRLIRRVFSTGWFLGIALVSGILSLLGGIIRGILPLLLIGAGLTLIASAYSSAKARKEGLAEGTVNEEEPFRSFYTGRMG